MSRPRSNYSEIAIKYIMEKVNNYELLDGDTISDMDISQALGISRTPAREAILKLINDGILERTATKVVVKPVSLADIYEILDARRALELAAAQTVLKRGGLIPEEEAELKSIQEQMIASIRSGDFTQNFSLDDYFHECIVRYSKNSRILGFFQMLKWQSQRLRHISIFSPERYQHTITEHQAILDAFLSKDLNRVTQSISDHFDETQENYNAILNSPQWTRIMKGLLNMSNR